MLDDDTTAPPVEEDTPTPEAPEEGHASPEPADDPYEKRYGDLRSEFDRRNQAEATLKARLSDPEQVRAVLEEEFGYQFGEDEPKEDDEDPEFRDPRVDRLLQERQQEAEEAKQEELVELEIGYINQQLAPLVEKHHLSEDEIQWVGDSSRQHRNSEGYPDVEGAVKRLEGLYEARQKSYLEGKRRAQQAPVGRSGTEKVDLSSSQERRRLMAEAMEAEGDSG